MNEFIPMNDYVLVEIVEKKNEGLYFGEDKSKAKEGTILAFSNECKNKNFEKGKNVLINHYELIPVADSDSMYFVSEKAIIAMF